MRYQLRHVPVGEITISAATPQSSPDCDGARRRRPAQQGAGRSLLTISSPVAAVPTAWTIQPPDPQVPIVDDHEVTSLLSTSKLTNSVPSKKMCTLDPTCRPVPTSVTQMQPSGHG